MTVPAVEWLAEPLRSHVKRLQAMPVRPGFDVQPACLAGPGYVPGAALWLAVEPCSKGNSKMIVRGRGRASGKRFIKSKPEDEARERSWRYLAGVAWGTRLMLRGTLRVDMAAIYAVPRSWSAQDQADAIAGLILPTGDGNDTHDRGNVLKLAEDVLAGLVYPNDSAVWGGDPVKLYGANEGVLWVIQETGHRHPPAKAKAMEKRERACRASR